MSDSICHLEPGEELMDDHTFSSLLTTLEDARHRAGVGMTAGDAPEAAPADSAPEPAPVAALRVGEHGAAPVAPRWSATPAHPAAGTGAQRAGGASPVVRFSEPTSGPAASLAAELDRSDSHETAACLAVHLARSYASATALFSVRNRTIIGVASSGLAGRERKVALTTEVPCLFSRVATVGRTVRGTPGGNSLDQAVIELLGRRHVREMALLPVELHGRVLALLYVDNGSDALGDSALAALDAVCTRLARVYQRLILERRQPLS